MTSVRLDARFPDFVPVCRLTDREFRKYVGDLLKFGPREPAATKVARRRWERIRKEIRPLVFERDGFRCVQCGTAEDLQVDHRIPIARGGGNALDNLQTMCWPCNRAKGAS